METDSFKLWREAFPNISVGDCLSDIVYQTGHTLWRDDQSSTESK